MSTASTTTWAKETVRNLPVSRFCNGIFEPSGTARDQDADGTLMLLEDDSLMSVGSTYLLITEASQGNVDSEKVGSQGVYLLVAPGFDHPVANSEAARQELQRRFSDAYANEVDPRLIIDP